VFKNNSDYPVTVFHTPVEYGMGNYRKLGIVNPGAEQVYPSLMNPLYDGQCNFRYEYDSNRVDYTEKNEYTPYPVNGNVHIQVNVTFSNKMSGQSAAPAPPGTSLREGVYTTPARTISVFEFYLNGGTATRYRDGRKDVSGPYTIEGTTLTITVTVNGLTFPMVYTITSPSSFTGYGDTWTRARDIAAAPAPAPAPPPAAPDFLTRPVLPAPALQMGLYSLIGGRLNMDIHQLGGGNFFVLYENGSGDKALARGKFTIQGSTISFTCENSEASSPGLRGKTRAYTITGAASFTGSGETWKQL
jgi:hypothetical protein